MFWTIYFILIPFAFLCILVICLTPDCDYRKPITVLKENYHNITIAHIVISLLVALIPVVNGIIILIQIIMFIVISVNWDKKIFK